MDNEEKTYDVLEAIFPNIEILNANTSIERPSSEYITFKLLESNPLDEGDLDMLNSCIHTLWEHKMEVCFFKVNVIDNARLFLNSLKTPQILVLMAQKNLGYSRTSTIRNKPRINMVLWEAMAAITIDFNEVITTEIDIVPIKRVTINNKTISI